MAPDTPWLKLDAQHSFYPPPKSLRLGPKGEVRAECAAHAPAHSANSGNSGSSGSSWAGGLRSCASGSSRSSSNVKGKGKGKGWNRVESESECEMGAVTVTTSLEVPLKVLRLSWRQAVSAVSAARIEVDASRRDGYGRITIVGTWHHSLLAYQCLMRRFYKTDLNVSGAPRIWRGKAAK
ncbi:unnamed protein product [Effrenium voratum]|nr:unnamed protein product [Effrenium voratum]